MPNRIVYVPDIETACASGLRSVADHIESGHPEDAAYLRRIASDLYVEMRVLRRKQGGA